MNDVIIQSISKADFSSWSYKKKFKVELSALGLLLDPGHWRFNKIDFYTMNNKEKIKDH